MSGIECPPVKNLRELGTLILVAGAPMALALLVGFEPERERNTRDSRGR